MTNCFAKNIRSASPLAVLFLLAACESHDTDPRGADAPLTSAAAWTIDPSPILEIGKRSGEPGHDLFRVVGAVLRGDGSLVVANAGAPDVRIFSAAGELVTRFGQAGDGPGDFRFMSGIALCGGDSLAVFQPGRITIFGAGGEAARVVSPPPFEGSPEPEPVSAGSERCDESIWLSRGAMPFDTSGYVEQQYTLSKSDGVAQRPITSFAGTVRYRTTVDGQPAMIRLPWSPEPSWAAKNGALFWTSGADDVVRHWDTAGDSTTLRSGMLQPSISTEEQSLYSAARSALIAEEPRYATSLLPWDQLPAAPTVRPTVSHMIADGDGQVWLRPFPAPSDGIGGEQEADSSSLVTWTVLSSRGDTRAQVQLPASFALTDVRDSLVAGVWTDEDGVESVRLYRLNREQ